MLRLNVSVTVLNTRNAASSPADTTFCPSDPWYRTHSGGAEWPSLTRSSRAPPSGMSKIHSRIELSGDVVNSSGSLAKHTAVVTA